MPNASANASAPPSNGSFSPWFELHGSPAVHVLGTRFSLGQGGMPSLLAARLQLFRAITLPSVAAQASAHFAWLVWVDETLPAWARDALARDLAPLPHARLAFATNASEFKWSPARQLRLARWPPPPRRAARALQLSTRLDADDALPRGALAAAAAALAERLAAAPRRMPWFVCWEAFVSWQPEAAAPLGALRAEAQTFCVSAGLTKLSRNARGPSVYAHRHAFAKGKSRHRPVASLFAGSLVILPAGEAAPLRARSITSDAMLHVQLANASSRRRALPARLAEAGAAERLRRVYNISAAALAACNAYMVAHEADIARSKSEEMPAACFKGFACRRTAKPEQMVLRSGKWVTVQQAAEWDARRPAEG
ncbi:hypothetical protein AB1Y20_017062 [Prymnesium parvum]|uniref:Uncharacterized protein n=1 Tax=Prymnesium parvum TaxID=97485 RepID=A0AB34I9V3_PRYPA